MANFRSLTIQSGVYKQIQDANSLIVGAGLTTATGDLTLSASGNIALAANKNLSAVAGTGALDFSGSSGNFSTSSGFNNLNGDVVVASNKYIEADSGAEARTRRLPSRHTSCVGKKERREMIYECRECHKQVVLRPPFGPP